MTSLTASLASCAGAASSWPRSLRKASSPAAAALFCAALAQHLADRDVELASETVCWAVFALPALARAAARRYAARHKAAAAAAAASDARPPRGSLVFALGLAVACWYRAEEHVVVLYVRCQAPTPTPTRR